MYVAGLDFVFSLLSVFVCVGLCENLIVCVSVYCESTAQAANQTGWIGGPHFEPRVALKAARATISELPFNDEVLKKF